MTGATGLDGLAPLPLSATDDERSERYKAVIEAVQLTLQGEKDWVAAMATAACLLHEAFEYYHWTGFYQAGPPGANTLVVGPYQGHLACLRIPYSRGVCGAAARSRATQLVPHVAAFPGYIACASSTQSEIVVPVVERRAADQAGAAPGGAPAAGGVAQAARGGERGEGGGAGGSEPSGRLLAVLDIDSDHPAAFTAADQHCLEQLCEWLGRQGFE